MLHSYDRYVAIVGYVVIFGALIALAVLGLRWTRLRPGERRETVDDNPGAPSLGGTKDPTLGGFRFGGDPIIDD
jgi:hypothetical protein